MLMTYRQAAELLECSYQTVRFAVTEERLTKVVTKKGPRLIEEQVKLFKGKSAISDMFLNLEERNMWQECKKQAEKVSMVESNFQETLVELLRSIDTKQSFSEEKLATIEKINNVMDECLKLIRSITNNTGLDITKDKTESFPQLPSILENV